MKTLTDLFEDYLDHLRSLQSSPWYIASNVSVGGMFLRWLETIGVRSADQLRRIHLEAWPKHLTGCRTYRGLPLKLNTFNKRLGVARLFMKYLAGQGCVPTAWVNVVRYVREPKMLPSSVLNHEQVRRLLQHVATTDAMGWRNRALLEVVYSAGLRASELLGLNVTDVDFAAGTALVLGKGRKQRVVPIGKTALRVLESYLRAVRPFLVRDPAEPALFLNHAGRRLNYQVLLRMVHRYAGQAGLEITVTPHTFRRSCTTELIRGGANLYHVKELLGHEKLDTLEHYTRLTIEDLKKTHARCHPRERNS
jgi:site-specific recombinase XerD